MRLNSITIKTVHAILVTSILAFAINIYVVDRAEAAKAVERLNKLRVVFAVQQSSEDLTKFATDYVYTGDQKSKENYLQVVSIRNGSSKRPTKLNSTYWFLSPKDQKLRHPLLSKKSLTEIALEANFTKEEKVDFFNALTLSERLAEIEIDMFRVRDNNQTEKALSILHSDKYKNIKKQIMNKINSFSTLVNTNIDEELEKLNQEKLYSLIRLLVSVFLLSIFPMITKIRY